jgi:hypothetical protein
MASLKFNIPQLDYTTRFSPWKVKMRVILAQTSDIDDALDVFGKKATSTWTDEEIGRTIGFVFDSTSSIQ